MDSLIAIGSTAALGIRRVLPSTASAMAWAGGTMRWCPNITWIFISNRRR